EETTSNSRLLSRRSLLRGGAALIAGSSIVPLLAACGGGGGDSTPEPGSGGSSADPAQAPSGGDDSTPASGSDEPAGDVVLNVAVAEEPPSLEPHNLTAAAAGLIGFVVLPGLVWWDFDLGLSPQAAEKWETSEDGTEWTFTLRDNLTFHNGKKCDAQEVLRNFEHIQDPSSGSMLTPDFEDVVVSAPDDSTVVFKLNEPFAP